MNTDNSITRHKDISPRLHILKYMNGSVCVDGGGGAIRQPQAKRGGEAALDLYIRHFPTKDTKHRF